MESAWSEVVRRVVPAASLLWCRLWNLSYNMFDNTTLYYTLVY